MLTSRASSPGTSSDPPWPTAPLSRSPPFPAPPTCAPWFARPSGPLTTWGGLEGQVVGVAASPHAAARKETADGRLPDGTVLDGVVGAQLRARLRPATDRVRTERVAPDRLGLPTLPEPGAPSFDGERIMDSCCHVAGTFYACWPKGRLGLLKASVDRVFALLAAPHSDEEDWRAAVVAEVALWGVLRAAPAPPVPGSRAVLHARGGELLDLLAVAGVDLREAVDGRDPQWFARAMAGLDGAERVARTVFAAAFALADGLEAGG